MSTLSHIPSDQSISSMDGESTSASVTSDSEIEDFETGSNDDLTSPTSPQSSSRRRILVTGGAGFIGSATAAALLERGDDVVIIDELNDYYDLNVKRGNLARLTKKYGPERCTIYIGDICDQELVEGIFERHDIADVIHLAARAGVRPSINDPFIYVHSNVRGQVTLMEAARRHGIGTFVYASSSSVYGGSKNELFKETDIVDKPCSQYAATKKSCELMAATYHSLYGMNTTGLRFFTVYGPNGRPDMAPFKFIDRVYRGVAMDQYGDGSSERDYTYIDDIVQGVVLSVDKPQGNTVFNLGKGGCTSLKYFIDLVQKYVGKKAIINYLPDQPGDVPRTRADISHAQKRLGYNPSTSFEEGLLKTVRWYLETYGEEKQQAGSSAASSSPVPTLAADCSGLTVATRLHSIKDSDIPATMQTLGTFLERATAFAPRVSIAVGCTLERSESGSNQLLSAVTKAAAAYGGKVVVVPVLDWSGFTPALNALLAEAAKAKSSAIMFASLEVAVDIAGASRLLGELTTDTLVVGARLPGHTFHEGQGLLHGTTSPWNTLAVWSVAKLVKTGFLTVSDGLASRGDAGVEEVSVIALHQSFAPTHSKAKLVEVPGVEWQRKWSDDDRREYHEKKMNSKAARAEAQQRVLGVATGSVLHC